MTELDWHVELHRCHPTGKAGDTWTCPECDKTWIAKPTVMWRLVDWQPAASPSPHADQRDEGAGQ